MVCNKKVRYFATKWYHFSVFFKVCCSFRVEK